MSSKQGPRSTSTTTIPAVPATPGAILGPAPGPGAGPAAAGTAQSTISGNEGICGDEAGQPTTTPSPAATIPTTTCP